MLAPSVERNHPKVLTPRHCLVVTLAYRGIAWDKIGKRTGYSKSRITQVLSSPAGKAYMDSLLRADQELVLRDPIEEVKKELADEALPSIRKLAKLRDTSQAERVQLSAANSLLDRTVPRKVQQAPPAATFMLPDTVAERLLAALGEAGLKREAIEAETVEAIEPPSQTPTSSPPPAMAPPDQAAPEIADQESDPDKE